MPTTEQSGHRDDAATQRFELQSGVAGAGLEVCSGQFARVSVTCRYSRVAWHGRPVEATA